MTLSEVQNQIGSLGENEDILGYFECCIDFMHGFLVPTNLRLMFIQGGGKFDKRFKKLFDVPYDCIEEISWDANTYLFITLKGKEYRKKVEPVDSPLTLLEKAVRPYIDIKKQFTHYSGDMRVRTD